MYILLPWIAFSTFQEVSHLGEDLELCPVGDSSLDILLGLLLSGAVVQWWFIFCSCSCTTLTHLCIKLGTFPFPSVSHRKCQCDQNVSWGKGTRDTWVLSRLFMYLICALWTSWSGIPGVPHPFYCGLLPEPPNIIIQWIWKYLIYE